MYILYIYLDTVSCMSIHVFWTQCSNLSAECTLQGDMSHTEPQVPQASEMCKLLGRDCLSIAK